MEAARVFDRKSLPELTLDRAKYHRVCWIWWDRIDDLKVPRTERVWEERGEGRT